VYDGRRWAEDATAEVVRRVNNTQRALYRSAAGQLQALGEVGDDQHRKDEFARLSRVLKHALSWQDARTIERCVKLMRSEPGVPVLPHQLDADPFLFNVLNGTLDLRTGELRPHRREDLVTKLAPVWYHADRAACPLWERFLRRVLADNDDLIDYLRRVVGYGLTADVSEQCLWLLYGTGSNGKTTFLTTLLALLGDYGMQAVSELLLAKAHEAHPAERADLCGRRLVCTVEVDEGKRMAESLMKQLTGGDRMRARGLYQDFFEFDQTWKILLAVNHKPAVQGTDHAVWRRIKLVPFTVTITDEEKDKGLPHKLQGELAGILAWAVRGCLEWQRAGLGEPEEVTHATDAYKSEQDTLARFIAECCFVHPDASVQTSRLLQVYHDWIGNESMNQPTFTAKMEAKGYVSQPGAGNRKFYKGIGLPAG
jgi:putative DNA primase/helicase